jgi:hypothetical protein
VIEGEVEGTLAGSAGKVIVWGVRIGAPVFATMRMTLLPVSAM